MSKVPVGFMSVSCEGLGARLSLIDRLVSNRNLHNR